MYKLVRSLINKVEFLIYDLLPKPGGNSLNSSRASLILSSIDHGNALYFARVLSTVSRSSGYFVFCSNTRHRVSGSNMFSETSCPFAKQQEQHRQVVYRILKSSCDKTIQLIGLNFLTCQKYSFYFLLF